MIHAEGSNAIQMTVLDPPNVVIDAVSPARLYVWRCCSCTNIVAEIDLPPGAVVQIRCKCNAWNSVQTFADHQGMFTSFGGSTAGPIFQRHKMTGGGANTAR